MQYYTVKEIAALTGVTIKTLHHYHKIGLLEPYKMTDAGYRLYGIKELERLQQILFYRELDFPLTDIKKALEDEPSRIACLTKQHKLLCARRQRMDRLLSTIEESIVFTKKGENMDKSAMFKGFDKEEWTEALTEQNEYLKDKYGYDMLDSQEIEPEQMNKQALEAQQFTNCLINGLKSGWRADDERLQKALKEHISFLNEHGTNMDGKSFVNLAKFMLEDDFHRNMLEGQQIGLSYYLYTAAEMYAAKA
ncbi:DNA-binding transcriptional MerR regulator [Anaerosolibacter carboniphilus]|uniref:DNA-binding transcriptional MerR regulator n=1 Tax=Anaerosolibacter carboniphilus TaxID=1417629 RepID=A0A841KWD1_9FIRM|nr:MerR family transcriptional regulator [Anaerosolibacter carboniphilus]MBB6214485.1 DNA-binding transcriptional MerR regulator [Anaerosolibacter carboniphilus]